MYPATIVIFLLLSVQTHAQTTKATANSPSTKVNSVSLKTSTLPPTTKATTTTLADTSTSETTTTTPPPTAPSSTIPTTKHTTLKPTTKPTTPKPITKPTSPKPTTKPTTPKPTTKTTTQNPTTKTPTPNPTTKPTTPKPTTKPSTPKPTTKPTTPKPTTKPTTPKPITKPSTTKPTIKQTTPKPTTKPSTPKPTNTTTLKTNQTTTLASLTTKQSKLTTQSTYSSTQSGGSTTGSTAGSTKVAASNTTGNISGSTSTQTVVTNSTNSSNGSVTTPAPTTAKPVVTTTKATLPPTHYGTKDLRTDIATTDELTVTLLLKDNSNCSKQDWTKFDGRPHSLGLDKVIEAENVKCKSSSEVEVKLVMFAAQANSFNLTSFLQPFETSNLHINNSNQAKASVTQFLKQYKDNVCLAKYVCPSAYKCDSNRRKCIHLCEDFNCGDNGVCQVTVDTSGIATAECRCNSDDDDRYSGEHCENSEASKLRQRKVMLGVMIPIILILFFIIVFMCFKFNRGDSFESKKQYELSSI